MYVCIHVCVCVCVCVCVFVPVSVHLDVVVMFSCLTALYIFAEKSIPRANFIHVCSPALLWMKWQTLKGQRSKGHNQCTPS